MDVSISKPQKGVVTITFEIPFSEIQEKEKESFNILLKNLKVEGFRKGKVPENIAKNRISLTDTRQHMIERMIPIWYREGIVSNKLFVISEPEVEIVSMKENEPMTFTAKVSIKPDVKLADLSKLIVKKDTPKVTKKDVDTALKDILAQYATFEPKDKKGANGNVAKMNIVATDGDETVKAFSRNDFELVLGDGYFVPGFDEHIIGAKKGDKKSFDITMPKDYPLERFQGKKLHFEVDVIEIKVKTTPKPTDDMAKSLGATDAKDLLEKVEHSLLHMKEEEGEKKFIKDTLDAFSKASKVEIPEILIEDEIHKMEHEFRFHLEKKGLTFENYLESQKKTIDEMKKEWKPQAEEVARIGLLLDELSIEKKIAVQDEEIDFEVEMWLRNYRDSKGNLTEEGKNTKKTFQTEKGRNYLRGIIRKEKTKHFLITEIKKSSGIKDPSHNHEHDHNGHVHDESDDHDHTHATKKETQSKEKATGKKKTAKQDKLI